MAYIDRSKTFPDVPEQFLVYRRSIGRLLRNGMVVGAVLPSILYLFVKLNFPLSFLILDASSYGISMLSAACGAGDVFDIFRMWYFVMGMLMVVLIGIAAAKFPYGLLDVLWGRIRGVRLKIFTMAGMSLFSYLFFRIFVSGRGGCLAENTSAGHARSMLLALQDSLVGMALVGPIFWSLCFLIWSLTFVCVLAGFQSILFKKRDGSQ